MPNYSHLADSWWLLESYQFQLPVFYAFLLLVISLSGISNVLLTARFCAFGGDAKNLKTVHWNLHKVVIGCFDDADEPWFVFELFYLVLMVRIDA